MSSAVDAPGWPRRRVLMSDPLSSTFEQLTVSQNPPTESEVALARTIVLKGKKELKELRAQISKLKAREQALTKHIADHQRIVFSINRFPPEILSLIFLYTVSSDLTGKPVHTESPWLVSQVCKLWRDISLASQVLWASPKIHPIPNQSPSQLILQLARSGNARLHPILAGCPRHNPRLPHLLVPLIAHSERWVSLLFTMNWTLMPEQLIALRGHVSQLEELQIEGVWNSGDTALPEGSRLDAFAIAPRLRTLSVTDVCEPAVSLLMPWHQLTQYRAVGTGHEHLSVLSLCPNLIAADLGFPVSFTIVAGAPVLVHLPQLVQLTLGDADLLRVLSLPVLQRVVLQRTAPEDDALLPLLDLVRRDRPPLRSLALLHSALVTPTLVAVLSEIPTVDTLRLHIRRGDAAAADDLVSQLTLRSGEDALAPNLTTLELVGHGAFDQERFVDMVESRWDPPFLDSPPVCDPILEVILRTTPKAPLSPQTIERLSDMEEEGLRVILATFSFFVGDLASHFSN
ncbi:hypothetical protein DFH06DRAFT_1179313 [Mycena polygramma]|nr:hypothetical protein DFH06DRAFT_1179313 [Mycena polygramma]